MNKFLCFGAVGTLLLTSLQSGSLQKLATVNLTVIQDGHKRPAPNRIKLSFGDHSLQVPVQEGRFQVPPEFVAARKVILETEVGESHIRLTKIAGADFTAKHWMLRLSESINDDYEWPGPKEADIPASCMLEFDSGHEDSARVLFEQHCRTRKK